jgi:hypothetical protein
MKKPPRSAPKSLFAVFRIGSVWERRLPTLSAFCWRCLSSACQMSLPSAVLGFPE